MEETLPEVALGGRRAATVAVKVAVPFALFWVREMAVAPIVNLLMPAGVFFVAGQFVGHQRGDDGLVVRPPELHVVPVFLNWFVEQVSEVEQAATFFVPAACPHPVEHVAAESDQTRISAMPAFLHDEPGSFNGVAGVEQPSVAVIHDVAVRCDRFHDDAQVRLHESTANLVEAAVNPRGEVRVVPQVCSQFLSGDEGDHARPHADHRPRVGELRRHQARSEVPAREIVEQLSRPPRRAFVAGGFEVGGMSYRRERFTVGVAPFAERLAVARDVKKHAAVGVEAMTFQKLQSALRPCQPLRPRLDRVVEREQHPAHTALCRTASAACQPAGPSAGPSAFAGRSPLAFARPRAMGCYSHFIWH